MLWQINVIPGQVCNILGKINFRKINGDECIHKQEEF